MRQIQMIALKLWFNAVKDEVETFNSELPNYIDNVIAEHTERKNKNQNLEDEIDSWQLP